MIEVKIPKQIKVGGFDYEILMNDEVTKELSDADGCWGKCQNALRRILLDKNADSVQLTNTFVHELLHAVDSIYLNGALNDTQVTEITNGLHQIFEQLDIRFVK